MRISKAYVRFYKSFNFDYLRKSRPNAEPKPWETLENGNWYPFVVVDLEAGITTVVGANESGKSQLLSAIRHGLTGEGIEASDFCRYSRFFAVDRTMLLPDFGVEFGGLSEADRQAVGATCGLEDASGITQFSLFRFGSGLVRIYLQIGDEVKEHDVSDLSQLNPVIPVPFDIDSSVPLPDSVPIQYLQNPVDGDRSISSRESRRNFLRGILNESPGEAGAPEQQSRQVALLEAFRTQSGLNPASQAQLRLAHDLLSIVASVNRDAFDQLANAISNGKEAYANGIVEQINKELARSLNFHKWWTQDRDFQLLVTLRDMDLVFTIRDRTGTEYAFSERSGGLKFFLSYFVQYLSHKPPATCSPEILLMDEPDAYLSSQGQQDLLRIFDGFAYPEDDRRSCQVVYVTHSPFLIDKNHADRIRVLEKGEGDEGSRVLKDAGRNHYEPLRSAFGGFVAETTFIGNCNLMLEGTADQVLIAGMATFLRSVGTPSTENLDLNEITLVPAGSASHIPYLTYLARGRDVERPAIIVLLDSDKSGDLAKKALKRGGAREKQVIAEKFVVQLGNLPGEVMQIDNPEGIREIEDIIAVEDALAAAREYVAEFCGAGDAEKISHLGASDLLYGSGKSIHAVIEEAFRSILGEEFDLDKVGMARAVVEVVKRRPDGADSPTANNFRRLFRLLGKLQREAVREIAVEKSGSRIKRATLSFAQDHPGGATREEAVIFFEDPAFLLDSSLETERLNLEILRLKREFGLDSDLGESISNFENFLSQLDSLSYQERRESQEE
jgi:hypothetical protein